MTEQELTAIEKRCAEATPGPWLTKPTGEKYMGFSLDVLIAATAPGKFNRIYANPPGGRYPAADQNFIAAARTDTPLLVAEVRRLTVLCERARNVMLFHTGRCPLNPMHNYSGSESHLSEYRHVMRDIDAALQEE